MTPELRALVESAPLAHLSTINADGSPQVSVVWLGLDGDELVTAHMRRSYLKLRNIDRDPRVVLSFAAPPTPGVFLAEHAVVRATARIEGPTEDAWELLDRLAHVYMGAGFPAPRGPGWIVRYTVERVGGVGPWAEQR
jgi:PPOX class probable F420-dependent enzyme